MSGVRDRADQQPAGEKVALLVLGMHRSGTSALTRVLNLLGCSLPHQVMDSNPTNPAGHWEPQAIVDLNDQILEAAGSAWDDWQKLNPGWEMSPARAGFMHKAGRTLQLEYEDTSFFVLKDPRICRIAPFWLDVLNKNRIVPRIVIPVRNPLEVAASLHARDGIDPSLGYLIWLRYILDAERSTRRIKRVFVSYSGLLDDWSRVAQHIAEGLSISWPRFSPRVTFEIETFLDKSLRHHMRNDLGALNGSLVPAWVRQAYEIVSRWSEGTESAKDFSDLDAIADDLDRAATVFATPMALFQRTSKRLQEAGEHIVAADADRDLAIDRANTVERSLHERGEEVARLVAELSERDNQLEAFREECGAVFDRADTAERSLHERGEEVARLVAELSERDNQLEALRDERGAALDRADTAERSLHERNEEIARLAADLADSGGQLEAVRGERDASMERAATIERSLSEQAKKVEQLAARLREQEALLDAIRGERESASNRADAAEQSLLARSKELDTVSAKLETAEARQAELQEKLEAAQEWRLNAEQDLIDRQRKHEAVAAKLAETGSELLQRKEELRQIWAELAAEKDRVEALEAECERNDKEQARQQRLLEREQELGRERQRNLEATQKELASVRSALAEAKKSLDQAINDSADSRAKLEAIEAELEKTHAAARLAVSQRSQTFNEIAIVTQLLKDTEHEVQSRDETVQWLSQVYAIMLRRPRWWMFLPRKAQFKRLSRRVELRGMFDSESYLAKNPDVAMTGADPLRHYITHGIKESRRR